MTVQQKPQILEIDNTIAPLIGRYQSAILKTDPLHEIVNHTVSNLLNFDPRGSDFRVPGIADNSIFDSSLMQSAQQSPLVNFALYAWTNPELNKQLVREYKTSPEERGIGNILEPLRLISVLLLSIDRQTAKEESLLFEFDDAEVEEHYFNHLVVFVKGVLEGIINNRGRQQQTESQNVAVRPNRTYRENPSEYFNNRDVDVDEDEDGDGDGDQDESEYRDKNESDRNQSSSKNNHQISGTSNNNGVINAGGIGALINQLIPTSPSQSAQLVLTPPKIPVERDFDNQEPDANRSISDDWDDLQQRFALTIKSLEVFGLHFIKERGNSKITNNEYTQALGILGSNLIFPGHLFLSALTLATRVGIKSSVAATYGAVEHVIKKPANAWLFVMQSMQNLSSQILHSIPIVKNVAYGEWQPHYFKIKPIDHRIKQLFLQDQNDSEAMREEVSALVISSLSVYGPKALQIIQDSASISEGIVSVTQKIPPTAGEILKLAVHIGGFIQYSIIETIFRLVQINIK